MSTTNPHADLIERMRRQLDGEEKQYETCDIVEAYNDLLRIAITALRTSYRDGWLDAAKWLEENPDEGQSLIEYGFVPTDSERLRRNAPQEATDEAR